MNLNLGGLGPLGGCQRFVGGIIAAIICFGVGGGIYFFMGDSFKQAYASMSWPTVQGQVVSSELREHRDSDGDIMYNADVRYAYRVDNQNYENTMITMMDGSTSVRASVQNTVYKYKAGTTVTIYYDPANPAFALLEPGIKGGVLILGAVMLCFPAVGLLALVGPLFGFVRAR
jgi:hypothetical protein